jgi:branched-chain amino acid transport system ATP-binding protein
MTEPLLEIHDLNKHFGGVVATDEVNLAVAQGQVHAIIGPNGAGKTTLIEQLSGQINPDCGDI